MQVQLGKGVSRVRKGDQSERQATGEEMNAKPESEEAQEWPFGSWRAGQSVEKCILRRYLGVV